jgi:hypothetical protein
MQKAVKPQSKASLSQKACAFLLRHDESIPLISAGISIIGTSFVILTDHPTIMRAGAVVGGLGLSAFLTSIPVLDILRTRKEQEAEKQLDRTGKYPWQDNF